jgi:hypothetical protein
MHRLLITSTISSSLCVAQYSGFFSPSELKAGREVQPFAMHL